MSSDALLSANSVLTEQKDTDIIFTLIYSCPNVDIEICKHCSIA